MKKYLFGMPIVAMVVMVSMFFSCGNNGNANQAETDPDSVTVESAGMTTSNTYDSNHENEKEDEVETGTGNVNASEQDVQLIKKWYDYVFGVKDISDNIFDKFLSTDTKKRLWTEDYDGCYEYWRFRTTAQDYDPKVGDVSKIESITEKGDGWYEVKYLDMGNKGETKIKIGNNKIIDFVQDSSWDSWD